MSLDAVRWEDGRLLILDQRELPAKEVWLEARAWEEVANAIRDMAVRGAPLIGIAAAYGMALAQQAGANLQEARRGLAATRPTAVNLFHALQRAARASDMLHEAHAIEQEERESNDEIGRHGAGLIQENARILTICNTGSLATAGIGTALGIVRVAHANSKLEQVFVCESRPRMQGLKLTSWELARDRIPFRVIADGAAAWLMAQGRVDAIVVGADRIAANGDTANKIGTYALALHARAHGIPFIIAAPSSTIDPETPSGSEIPIEERAAEELTMVGGLRVAPDECPVWNPAFDVTPANLISYIVTERVVHEPPFASLLEGAACR